MIEILAANLSMRIARRLRWIVTGMLVTLSPVFCVANEEPAEALSHQFLEDAGVSIEGLEEVFKSLRWEGTIPVLTSEEGEPTAKLMYRLDRALSSRNAAAPPMQANDVVEIGQLVTIEGRVRTIKQVKLPDAARAALEQDAVFLCGVEFSDGGGIGVLSRRAPSAWLENQPRVLDEPVRCVAVRVGEYRHGRASGRLYITSRFEWRPEAGVSAGVAWLTERGFDAALLDEIRHGRGFAKPHESLEGLAFYRCLAIVACSRPQELIQLAHEALPVRAEEAEANLADALATRENLAEKWCEASVPERKELSRQLESARRRQAIASGVVERAARGASSVAPLFLEPQAHTGEAVLIEGTARRAIRIVLDEDARRIAHGSPANSFQGRKAPPMTEYYELDVFTTDSQNLPIICCVARLPEGFPTGELIREPVRVGGIFFKQWSYLRRADHEGVSTKSRPPERLRPPLIVAAAPQWLRTAEASTPQNRGLWTGLVFLAVFLTGILAMVRVSRRDRLARAGRARYDSRLENIAEP